MILMRCRKTEQHIKGGCSQMKAIFLYIVCTCLSVVWAPNAHAERGKPNGVHGDGHFEKTEGTAGEPSAAPLDSIFPIHVYFDTASTVPISFTHVGQVVSWMRTSTVPLIIEGHADLRGDRDDNLELGDRRARQVKADLVREGADATRLVIVSQGETSPLSSLPGEVGWKENRVVSILPLVSSHP